MLCLDTPGISKCLINTWENSTHTLPFSLARKHRLPNHGHPPKKSYWRAANKGSWSDVIQNYDEDTNSKPLGTEGEKLLLWLMSVFSAHVSVLLPTYFWIQAAPGNVSSRERNSKRKILPSTSFFFFYPRVLLYLATIVKKLTAKTSSSWEA